jgi:hypothetical protein
LIELEIALAILIARENTGSSHVLCLFQADDRGLLAAVR